jgi:hypothetical protein
VWKGKVFDTNHEEILRKKLIVHLSVSLIAVHLRQSLLMIENKEKRESLVDWELHFHRPIGVN